MGKGSQQSKRKQQTSKKESQTTPNETVNGALKQVAVHVSKEQGKLFKELLRAVHESQNNLNFALLAANIPGESIVGGDLDSEEPHFIIQVKDS